MAGRKALRPTFTRYYGLSTDPAPSNAHSGDQRFDTDTGSLYETDGAGHWYLSPDRVDYVPTSPSGLSLETSQQDVLTALNSLLSLGAPLSTVACGELAGSASAVQMPNVPCSTIKFKAAVDNAGNVYIGGAGVTAANGSTDITTGLQLDAGEETGWLPVSNANLFYRICDNAGDDLTYIALA